MRELISERILGLVADAAARIDSLGWGEATAGNLSLLLEPSDLIAPFRAEAAPLELVPASADAPLRGRSAIETGWPVDRYLLISATGSRMRELASRPEEGLCLVGAGGGRLHAAVGSRKASSELPVHLAVLMNRAPGSALLHGHPEFLIALSHLRALQGEGTLERALLPLMPETVMFLGRGIKRMPFDMPGGMVLGARSAEALQSADILVWDRHGSLAVGNDVKQALDRLELAENAARVWWLAHQTGETPVGMPAGIFQSLRERFGAAGRGAGKS